MFQCSSNLDVTNMTWWTIINRSYNAFALTQRCEFHKIHACPSVLTTINHWIEIISMQWWNNSRWGCILIFIYYINQYQLVLLNFFHQFNCVLINNLFYCNVMKWKCINLLSFWYFLPNSGFKVLHKYVLKL